MKNGRFLIAAFFLLALPGCVCWNTGEKLRATCVTYTAADVTRPLNGTVYQTDEYHVCMQVPEVTYQREPHVLDFHFMNTSVTPIKNLTDTGRYRWVSMQKRQLWYLTSRPKWMHVKANNFPPIHFEILEEAPAPETLAEAKKIQIKDGEIPPATIEAQIGAGATSRHSLWYPLAATASLPLSVLDMALCVITSVGYDSYLLVTEGLPLLWEMMNDE